MIRGYQKTYTRSYEFRKKDIRDLPKRFSFWGSVGSFVWEEKTVGTWYDRGSLRDEGMVPKLEVLNLISGYFGGGFSLT